MKTTVEIPDTLLARAKQLAKRTGRPLRSVMEEGLRRVLSEQAARASYQLPDWSVGDPDAKDPLETMSWQDLRDAIYGEPRKE